MCTSIAKRSCSTDESVRSTYADAGCLGQSRLRQSLVEKEQECSNLRERADRWKDAHTELQRDCDALRQEGERRNNEKADLVKKVELLNQSNYSKDGLIMRMQSELAGVKLENASLKQKSQEAEKSQKKGQESLMELKENHEKSRLKDHKRIATLQTQLRVAQNLESQMQKVVEELEDKVKTAEANTRKDEEHRQQLISKYEKMSRAITETENELARLQKENKELEGMHASQGRQMESFDELTRSKAELQRANGQLTNQVTALKGTIKAKENEREEGTGNYQDLAKTVSALQEMLTHTLKERDTARSQHATIFRILKYKDAEDRQRAYVEYEKACPEEIEQAKRLSYEREVQGMTGAKPGDTPSGFSRGT